MKLKSVFCGWMAGLFLLLSPVWEVAATPVTAAPMAALPDSALLADLDRTLYESLDQMVALKPFSQQFEEVRSFLSVVTDSLTRQHLALKCYDYYLHSPLNGAEEVAIQMTDSLFSTRKISMRNDIELLNARIYAEFNRPTLLGRQAPALTLYDRDRQPYPLFTADSSYSVLYFYSADCPKCQVETRLLRHMLENENPPIRLYAIYTDDDFEQWQHYIADDFQIDASRIEVIHLWDPDYVSDFKRIYGVLQTPKMFFLDPEHTILGRSLDTYALQLMIHGIEALHPYVYGSEESDKSFEELFGHFEPELSLADIQFFLAYTEKMFPEGDPQYKHTLGDLMLYLCRNRYRGSAYLEGASFIADSLVLAHPEYWTTPTDSLQVLGYTGFVQELAAMLPLGKQVPEVKVKGTLKTLEGSRTRRWNLQKLGRHLKGRPVYVVFYTDDCSNCRETLSIIHDFMEVAAPTDEGAEKMNFLLVNVGQLEKSHPRRFQRLLQQFDLSFMPFIFQLDGAGKVLDKYIYL